MIEKWDAKDCLMGQRGEGEGRDGSKRGTSSRYIQYFSKPAKQAKMLTSHAK